VLPTAPAPICLCLFWHTLPGNPFCFDILETIIDLSPIGEAVLIAREGRRLKAYKDSVGVLTIGIGHTSAAGVPLVTAGLT
jgi:hypothetical protein